LPDLKDLGNRIDVENLDHSFSETDEKGDSSDARENRSGYFMIRGIMKTLTLVVYFPVAGNSGSLSVSRIPPHGMFPAFAIKLTAVR